MRRMSGPIPSHPISTVTHLPDSPIVAGTSPEIMKVTPDGGTGLVLTSTGLRRYTGPSSAAVNSCSQISRTTGTRYRVAFTRESDRSFLTSQDAHDNVVGTGMCGRPVLGPGVRSLAAQ